ncbi:MAG: protein kinase [Chloroflexi bacterium]|nr:protein kinase [Chloroflexota bacterium]
MIGKVFAGKYKIIDEVGSGATSTVYMARNLDTNQILALKVLSQSSSTDAEFIRRFQREAVIIKNLNDPHIVRVYDFGCQDGIYFLAMEYVDGRPVSEELAKSGKLPLEKALNIAIQAAEGLQAAYRSGIVHRDIKPQNLMLDADGRLRIMDFGTARGGDLSSITVSNVFIGTPYYISPEQAEKGKSADIRSDLYSLGAVLFEMLSGKVPFQGDSAAMVVVKHMTDPVPSLTAQDPTIPSQIDQIVQKALAKDPAQRFQTPEEMRLVLKDALARVCRPAAPSPGVAREMPRPPVPAPPAATATPLLLSLESGQQFSVTVPECAIGRADPERGLYPHVDLQPLDLGRSVSRQHARIVCQGGTYFVMDAGSRNRTYLNQVALTPGQMYPLKDGDELWFGKVKVVFRLR